MQEIERLIAYQTPLQYTLNFTTDIKNLYNYNDDCTSVRDVSCAYIGLPCAVQCAMAQEDNSGHVMKEKNKWIKKVKTQTEVIFYDRYNNIQWK